MSTLNPKSGLNRLFPFAKKKPNIPSKILDKSDTKTSKQKSVEKKNCLIIKNPEQIQCEILTENNEKLKTVQEKAISNESPKKVLIDTYKLIISQNNESDIKSISRKLSNASEISMEGIKKSKETYQRWNIPLSNKFKGKDVDKTLLTMQDLIYYNPVSNPILRETKIELKEEDDPDNDLLPIKTDQDQKSSVPKNCITPCIKVGADGKIIIDQETLTLNETGLEEKREELAKSKVIEESTFRSFSYKRKQQPSKKWTKDETLKFYKCLMNLGTDFSMIEQYFPGRTRAQIKRKYKTEEKKNPQLINGALTNTTHYDGLLIENMFQEDEDFKETEKDKINKVNENLEMSVPPKTRKRLHKNLIRSDCSRISPCAYLMEEEIVLKKKRKPEGKMSTADSLKAEVSVLKSLKDKKKKYLPSTTVTNSKIKAIPEVNEQNSNPLPKVRRLQDFHEEYEEYTLLEQDSNSE
ncbi:Homeobox domain-like,SANT domain,SANT/Myb domain [Cinara cedri]|uniref:Homeobox domain-like,SANT domain,SANT/Myb domain n=1 Tax=Cinara cedri TaxID=506608 RepID=A0A5E4N946_9HEMI|nr:Homeobox domain-like,SANT domain,SANT/Myb domain [Cinara cedri]